MIVKAFIAIISKIADVIFALLPDVPVVPAFVVTSLTFMSDLMIGAAGMIKYILGSTVYNAALDYIVLIMGYKLFLKVFYFVKNIILMR